MDSLISNMEREYEMNVRNLVMPVTLILGIAVGDGNATVGVEGHKGLSIAAHASECSVCHQQQYISEPVISGTVSAGNPFDISFTLANTGAGHSIPEGLFRLIRTRVSIKDVSGQEIFSQE